MTSAAMTSAAMMPVWRMSDPRYVNKFIPMWLGVFFMIPAAMIGWIGGIFVQAALGYGEEPGALAFLFAAVLMAVTFYVMCREETRRRVYRRLAVMVEDEIGVPSGSWEGHNLKKYQDLQKVMMKSVKTGVSCPSFRDEVVQSGADWIMDNTVKMRHAFYDLKGLRSGS